MSDNSPNPTGAVGPSPGPNTIPAGDPTQTGGGLQPGETGEEEDPSVANAGGVNASNAGS